MVFAQEPAPKPPAKPASPKRTANRFPPDAAWHDVTKWGVEGRAWGDQERKRWFDRLPAKADGKVTAKEREHIEHAQNVESRKIYREKHDRQHDLNHDGRTDPR